MKSVQIYTDGACSGNPGPGGYGAILLYEGLEREISGGEPETTNNRMELRAAVEALQLLKTPCRVELYSDSSYLINSFHLGWIDKWARQGWTKEKGELKNVDLFQTLYQLAQVHQITWIKVKGHSDNEYNNRCDRLAVAESQKYGGRQEGGKAGKKASPSVVSAEAAVPLRDQEYHGSLQETALASREIFQGKVFRVEVLDVALPNGQMAQREIVRHSGGACVVPVDQEGNVYLVRQFRSGANQEMLEIPAGKMEPGEDPLVCATRELEEETGWKAGKICLLSAYYPTPAYCSEKLTIYLATDLKPSHPHRDENEFLHIERYSLEEALRMVEEGELEDGKTVAGLILAARRLGR